MNIHPLIKVIEKKHTSPKRYEFFSRVYYGKHIFGHNLKKLSRIKKVDQTIRSTSPKLDIIKFRILLGDFISRNPGKYLGDTYMSPCDNL